MVQETVRAPKRGLNAHGRALRRARIFARMSEGWGYRDIAREEGLTSERIRQIVSEAFEKDRIDEDSDHAKLQLARLARAMRLAGEAVAGGDVKAIPTLLKVINQLDRYQKVAKSNQVYDDEAREKLLDKINRVAANLGMDETPAAAGAEEAREGGEAREGETGEDQKVPEGA